MTNEEKHAARLIAANAAIIGANIQNRVMIPTDYLPQIIEAAENLHQVDSENPPTMEQVIENGDDFDNVARDIAAHIAETNTAPTANTIREFIAQL